MGKLIGISGFARSGKDTFYQRSKIALEKEGYKACRFAFADALKYEIDEILSKYTEISAFTENKTEKEMIRPLLVTWGTDIRRKIDQNCWIKRIQSDVESRIKEGYYVFITDVRYKNEAEWITINDGVLVNLTRHEIGPANHEEHRELHRMRPFISHKIYWNTFGEEELNQCDEYVVPFLSEIVTKENSKVEQLI